MFCYFIVSEICVEMLNKNGVGENESWNEANRKFELFERQVCDAGVQRFAENIVLRITTVW